MWILLKATLLQVWKELLVVGTIAGGVLLVLFKARDAGRQAERNESLQKTMKVVRERNEIRRDIVVVDDAEHQRLREKWTERD